MKAQTLGEPSSMEFMRGRRVFEINPEHPIIRDLNVRVVTFSVILKYVNVCWIVSSFSYAKQFALM